MSEDTRVIEQEGPGSEVVAVLTELEGLEASLGVEVNRLSSVQAPPAGGETRRLFRDRPLWWWRYRLIGWAHSRPIRAAHPGDVLRGLCIVLKEWDDNTLYDFLSRLPTSRPATLARRRSA